MSRGFHNFLMLQRPVRMTSSLYLHRFAETKRYMDFVNPGSQAKEGSFFGLEATLEGLAPGYLHFPMAK